uniref:Neuropeptide receptor n=2 Tax=Diaphorina citri TaxID=121845 RepID=A0A2U9PG81_DIACI|nr:neuropeptide receptor [Diaphorina citri]
MNRREDLNNIFEMYNLYKNSTANIGAAGGHEKSGPNIKHFLDILTTNRHGNDSDDLLNFLNQSLEYDYPSLEAVDPPLQIFLIVMYSLTAVLSLTGNTTAIIVLTFGRRSSGDLKVFLINLAISDLTMAIFSIPFTYTMFLYGRWLFPTWFCPVVMMMQHVSVIVSVYTLAAIGVDRYKAIVHPFDSRMKRYQSRYVMVGIWIMALCISSVQLIVSKTRSFTYDGEMHHECVEMWPEERHGQIYTAFIFTFTFAIPLLGLAYTYSIIAWKLWWRSAPGNADPCRDLHQLNAKIKVVKMLVTIVVMFALCWLPLQLFLFLFYFLPDFGVQHNDTAWQIYALSYFACHWMANANSCVNPFVYCFMSDNFRTDLKDICQRAFGKKRKWRERGICNESMRSYSTRTQTTGVLYHGNFASHNNSTRSATSIMSYRYNHSGNVMTVLPLKDVKRHSRAGSCTYQSYL